MAPTRLEDGGTVKVIDVRNFSETMLSVADRDRARGDAEMHCHPDADDGNTTSQARRE